MRRISYREALREALFEEMKRDKNVYLIGEEVGHYHGAYKVSKGLIEEFGEERVIDTPIAEEGFAGIAIGSAMIGLRPVVEFMTWNFSLVAIDQIINNAAKLRFMSGGQFSLPIVFRGPQGAGGYLGATHSQIFESFYTYVPGLKVVAPSTPYDAKGLLKSAIRDDNPVIFLEAERLYAYEGEVPEEEYLIPLGEAKIQKEGKDITLITWGWIYYVVKEAVEDLEKKGISVEIIDPRTLVPLDKEKIIKSVEKTNRVVIVEEAWLKGSFAEHIAYIIQNEAMDFLDAPIEIVATEDYPHPYSFSLEEEILPTVEKIQKACYKVLYEEERK